MSSAFGSPIIIAGANKGVISSGKRQVSYLPWNALLPSISPPGFDVLVVLGGELRFPNKKASEGGDGQQE